MVRLPPAGAVHSSRVSSSPRASAPSTRSSPRDACVLGYRKQLAAAAHTRDTRRSVSAARRVRGGGGRRRASGKQQSRGGFSRGAWCARGCGYHCGPEERCRRCRATGTSSSAAAGRAPRGPLLPDAGARPRLPPCPARRSRISALNASSRANHQPRRRVAHARQTAASTNREQSSARSSSSGSSSSSDSDNDGSDEESPSSPSATSLKDNDKKHKSSSEEEGDAMQTRLDWKLALLYTLLVLQVLIVMIYVTSTPHVAELNAPALRDTVSFVDLETPQAYYENKTMELRIISGETSLRDVKTFKLFQAYNRTLCWRSGVDDRKMRRGEFGEAPSERCACNQGWHGSDCGQPEVVWRAIMASKQNVKLERRKLARRIVHTFYVHDHNSAIAEVIVEELYRVVDLFVVCDFSLAEDNFRHKLAKGFLGKQQDKILYINVASKARKPARVVSKYVWDHVRKVVRNLRDDDIYVTTDAEQILNGRALLFLKTYDGWPQPIGFRLRWSVFGFFWQHPARTTISVGACTVGLVREAHRFNSLVLERELTNEVDERRESLGLVIGDLNHYGGWYCQYCQGPANIILALRHKNRTRDVAVGRSLDVPFIEDLIGSGMWFDEKTSLLRAYKSRESYFAPEAVMSQSWKYDWLVENFYAKLDYY